MDQILEMAGIPLLLCVLCLFYGIRMMITGDTTAIRGKEAGALKDEKMYAKYGGKLLLFYAGASLLMGVLSFVSVPLAVVEIIVGTIILGILWKRMNEKYGSIN